MSLIIFYGESTIVSIIINEIGNVKGWYYGIIPIRNNEGRAGWCLGMEILDEWSTPVNPLLKCHSVVTLLLSVLTKAKVARCFSVSFTRQFSYLRTYVTGDVYSHIVRTSITSWIISKFTTYRYC
jgi:hypothetical protein